MTNWAQGGFYTRLKKKSIKKTCVQVGSAGGKPASYQRYYLVFMYTT